MLVLGKYVAGSSLAAGLVIYHAFATREQFFPAVQYMTTSKVAMAVLGNFAFSFALVLYRVMTKVFLGTLRESEVEKINERVGQAVMETCLALTIFRDEINASFVTMFVILTFVKVFHWLIQDRVDYIETGPSVSRLQHFRAVSFMLTLLAIDMVCLQYTVGKTLQRSASVHLLFAFEYVIQTTIIVSTFIKYILSSIDSYLEGRWEHKGIYVFYLELVTDMLHLSVYLIFFIIVFTNYGLPLHLVRDLYWTFRNFRNRVADFLRYRRVTANMDERFSNASQADLDSDSVCIICREDMSPSSRNKKLPCGHVFHLHCLRSWLERQQSCPICRSSVFTQERNALRGEAGQGAANNNPAAPPQDQPQQQVPMAQAAGDQQGATAGASGRGGQAAGSSGAGASGDQQQPGGTGDTPGAPGGDGGTGGQGPPGRGPMNGVGPSHAAEGAVPMSGPRQAIPQQPGAFAAANYGYVWNVPQWVPATSMALFAPAAGGYPQLQYAGQQAPEAMHPQLISSSGVALPVMSMMMPPHFPAYSIPPPSPTATPEQQQQHQAAAAGAAAAAAAAASVISPYGAMMMPPTMRPIGSLGQPATSAPQPAVMNQATAAAAANAAAQAAVDAVLRSPVSASPAAQTSVETMEQVLRQQMDMLQAQIAQLQMQREAAERASAQGQRSLQDVPAASSQPPSSSAASSQALPDTSGS